MGTKATRSSVENHSVLDNASKPPIRLNPTVADFARIVVCPTPSAYAARNAGRQRRRPSVRLPTLSTGCWERQTALERAEWRIGKEVLPHQGQDLASEAIAIAQSKKNPHPKTFPWPSGR